MRFFAAAALFSASFVSAVLAEEMIHERYVPVLDKRQQFSPTTQTATGDTCADAFGDGYVVCRDVTATQNRLCYNPSAGQTCCSNSWACPSGSFCFTNGNCCPNGLSTTDCAASLASSSSSSTAAPTSSAPAKLASSTAKVNTTTSISTTSVKSSAKTTATVTGTSYGSKNSTSLIKATGTGAATPTKSPAAVFTGAASAMSLEIGAVAVGGIVALFGALL